MKFNKARFYRYFLSLVFGLIIVFHFYLIRWIVPKNITIYNEIVITIFILISILILFPIRSKLLSKFLERNNYLSLFGIDINQIDLAVHSLDMETFLHEDFPSFIDWLSFSSASIAIIGVERKTYRIYHYHKRKLVKESIIHRKSYEKLCSFLSNSPKSISINDKLLPKDVKEQMKNLDANTVHPLLYRSSVLGFFMTKETHRPLYTEKALEFFKHKSALIVQNYILSNRVIDSRIYDREFQMAQKVQRDLENTTEPELYDFTIKRIIEEGDLPPLIFEFIKLDQKKILFMALICEVFNGATGILVYSVLGQLYSFIHLRKNISLASLLKHMQENEDWHRASSSMKSLFFEVDEKTKHINFSTSEEFEIVYGTEKSNMKRKKLGQDDTSLQLTSDTSVKFIFRSIPFLQLSPKNNNSSRREKKNHKTSPIREIEKQKTLS